MQLQVVVFAQQHAPVEVGAAVISHVVVDVVGLTPGWRAFAALPEAAAVADGESDALMT